MKKWAGEVEKRVVLKNTTIQNWKGDLRYRDYGNQMKSAP
jgi:hypothetical protein